ncbi:syntaxin of plants SYP6 [Marchantia polymorpha subsp. ruderalis]|uniref:Syntaxin of plant 6B n=1 Tax=Marchantia polymorpha TaxID=3197 RepID=A0A0H5BGB3_MARPO|nr:hypothetical protein MARPO_0079s0013 [Marchantia polymorpha]BAS01253.1 syntaxin of plant 6B [Marchantia polymorpha]BBN20050.1 hypothetical protein Mp_8g16010 [Marchantia polymorpha subsp. ruderalis]|eukprot:PTQ34503.1 hypothetical protein MARPO_0079s0013 [Marchantia polymorpha]
MSHLDPYYLVKDEVQDSIAQLQSGMTQWKQLPEVSNERASLTKKLISSCDTIKWQVDELDKAVSVAERDMTKFGVSLTELQTRRAWISSTVTEVSSYRKTLQVADDALRLPMAAPLAAHGDALRGQIGPVQKNRQSFENDDYIHGEQERQTQYLKEQDEDLDDLSQSVQRMGNIGLAIHEELDSQEVLISDISRDVDTAATRLDYVQKKMETLIKKAGAKGQLVLIAVLVILLALLIMLIFYT